MSSQNSQTSFEAIEGFVTSGQGVKAFIRERVDPMRESINTWAKPRGTRTLLIQGARTTKKIYPAKFGPHLAFQHSGAAIGGYIAPYTTLVSDIAQRAAGVKHLQRQYLRASDLPFVEGREFGTSQLRSAQTYVSSIGGPVVVKPHSVQAQQATTLNVYPGDDFTAAWEKTLEANRNLPDLAQQITVEKQRSGLTIRLYVVGEEVAAALVLLPFYVKADSTSTLAQLVRAEREKRQACAFAAAYLAKTDQELLDSVDMAEDSVPHTDQIVLLAPESTGVMRGGLSVDVLKEVSPDLMLLATSAMWAFPGLRASAVDLVTSSLEDASDAVVLDVAPGAGIEEFAYPSYGKSRRVSLPIMEHMLAAQAA